MRPKIALLGVAIALVVFMAFSFLRGSEVPYTSLHYRSKLPEECSVVFDGAEIEVWGPSDQGLYRIKMTYPDGSSEWLIADGLDAQEPRSIWSPEVGTRVFGEPIMALGCPSLNVMAAPDGFLSSVLVTLGQFYSLEDVVTFGSESFLDWIYDNSLLVGSAEVGGVNSYEYEINQPIGGAIWIDEEHGRAQRIVVPAVLGEQSWTEDLEVIERRKTRISNSAFAIQDLKLVALLPSAG